MKRKAEKTDGVMLGKEVWQDLRHSGCRVIVFSRVLQTENFVKMFQTMVNITFVFEYECICT